MYYYLKMKTIKIEIPTSIKEFRMELKKRRDKRYKHNVDVLSRFAYDVIEEINSDYWKNDISPVMKNRISAKISQMLLGAKFILK